MSIQTADYETRNAELSDLIPLLQRAQADKADFVIPASAITSVKGVMHVKGTGFEARAGLDAESVGVFRATSIFDGQIASALKIPTAYLRRMRDERVDLYDANVNGWLHGHFHVREDGTIESGEDADGRRFLLRTFVDLADEGPGIARSLNSDSFKRIEHIDTIMAALQGIKESGVEVDIQPATVTETRMVFKVAAPGMGAMAPNLLKGYRSPRGPEGAAYTLEQLRKHYSPDHLGWGDEERPYPPIVFAGFEVSNSETGNGSCLVTPRIMVGACKNGIVLDLLAARKIHVGGKLEDGEVSWSDETHQKNLELISSMVKDAVKAFLSEDFVREAIAKLEEKAGTAVTDAVKTIEHVSKELAFTDEQQALILSHFVQGGQMTAGGVLQAITSAAQETASADLAYEMEHRAVKGMELAAALG